MAHQRIIGSNPSGSADLGIDFASVFAAAPVGLAVLDADLRYVQCNAALATINGIPASDHIGRTVREMVPELADKIEPRFRKVFQTGLSAGATKVTGSTPKAAGLERWYLENVTPLKDSRGRVRHILVTVQEITALEAAEAELRTSQRALGAWQQVSPDGLSIMRAVRDDHGAVTDFVWEYVNPAGLRIMGAGPLVGRRLTEILAGSREHPALLPRYAGLLTEPGLSEVELSYEHDGRTLWFRDAAVAIDSERIAVGFRDISRHKLKEEQARLVSRELRHRVKNVVAIVSALVSQKARFDPGSREFAESLRGRLDALAGAQDLLAAEGEKDVPLDAIARAALGPFGDARLRVQAGPPVAVRARSVTLLTMALNELATNAVKHGALSAPDGAATLSWMLQSDGLELLWRESGGPDVSPPAREGFGSRLLADAARRLPGGRLSREFRREGVQVTIAFDVTRGRAG